MNVDHLTWMKMQSYCTGRTPWETVDGTERRRMTVLGEPVFVSRADRSDAYDPDTECEMPQRLLEALRRDPDVGWLRRLANFGAWEMDLETLVVREAERCRRRRI